VEKQEKGNFLRLFPSIGTPGYIGRRRGSRGKGRGGGISRDRIEGGEWNGTQKEKKGRRDAYQPKNTQEGLRGEYRQKIMTGEG